MTVELRARSRAARAGPLLDDEMAVDPAESEGIDARAPYIALPRPRLAERDESAPGKRRMRLAAVDRRRQDAVVDGKRRLDQTGAGRGRHRVPDHRLHRPEPNLCRSG